MKNFHWTVVVLTCSTSKKAAVYKKELLLLQRKGVIDSQTALLTVEDPEQNVGSGGATLNAILVVTEYLSAKRGFSVLNADVLADSWILIIHNGRSYPFNSCSKGFIPLLDCSDETNQDTNLYNLLKVVSKLARGDGQRHAPGVWVYSADAYLHGSLSSFTPPDGAPSDDCVVYSVLASPEYGTGHGVLRLESGGSRRVADILYCRSLDDVRACRENENDDQVAVVCGVAFLSTALAESLLSLHTRTPISSCTYLGQDSGGDSLQISLFFDLLSAMASEISEEDFVAGECGKTYGTRHSYRTQHDATTRVRSLVWKELRRYRMTSVTLTGAEYLYWNERLPVQTHVDLLRKINDARPMSPDSVVGAAGQHGVVSILSSLHHVTAADVSGSPGLVQHSILHGSPNWPIIVGQNCFISNVNLDTGKLQSEVMFKDNIAYIEMRLEHSESSKGTSNTVLLHFGVTDELYANFQSSTVYNIPWQEFLRLTGLVPEDIWDEYLTNDERCLANAKLFPINCGVADIWWLKGVDCANQKSDTFRKSVRISISEAMNNVDLDSEFAFRREASAVLALQRSRDILLGRSEGSPIPLLTLAATEGWSHRMFDTLDQLLIETVETDPGTAARVLANVANLLGCLAAGEGGIRSGPAANREWSDALQVLEINSDGNISKGIRMLKEVRNRWLDTPQRMVRAARHYEGASQILIRHAVATASQFVALRSSALPDIGVWVKCECAARVDLAGGWTDTPPICYQLGGSVINASILVDGKRPIGAKVCRTKELAIVCTLDDNVRLCLRSVEDVLDYSEPTAIGALIKACLVYSGLVETSIDETLSDQLNRKYGGGFELCTWSDLPQGSGLGTSSIMAGAILAAVYLASGRLCDRTSIVHAVLCVEQLMTTGGGWQDQVGGLMGGVLHAHSQPSLPLRVRIERIRPSPQFAAILERHLVLIHTGKVRLAKNLLQNVLRNWFARDRRVLDTFRGLHRLSARLIDAISAENLEEIGQVMNEYWQLKKILAPSAEPVQVGKVMEQLRPFVYGQLLCGAGGGGFMLALTKQPDSQDSVFGIITDIQIFGFSLHGISFDPFGMDVTVGDISCDIDGQSN